MGMNYSNYESLATFLDRKGGFLAEEEVIRIGLDICKAAGDCHNKGYLHGGIDPNSILISMDGDNREAGQAFAILTAAEKTGSNRYVAPEIFNREKSGVQADIYSLGLVLYMLLNGNMLPFENTGDNTTEKEIADSKRLAGMPVSAPDSGSIILKKAVMRACDYDAENRFDSMDEFGMALGNCMSMTAPKPQTKEQKPEEEPENESEIKPVKARKGGKKILIGAGALAAAAVIIIAAVSLLGHSDGLVEEIDQMVSDADNKGSIVNTTEYFNGSVEKVCQDDDGNEVYTVKYSEDGSVFSERKICLNENGKGVCGAEYGKDGKMFKCWKTEYNSDESSGTVTYYDVDKNKATEKYQLKNQYNEYGKLTKTEKHMNGKLLSSSEYEWLDKDHQIRYTDYNAAGTKTYECVNEWDKDGRLIKETTDFCDDELVVKKFDYSAGKITAKESDEYFETVYSYEKDDTNPNGLKELGHKVYDEGEFSYECERKFDDNGNLIGDEYRDEDGQVTSRDWYMVEGYAYTTYGEGIKTNLTCRRQDGKSDSSVEFKGEFKGFKQLEDEWDEVVTAETQITYNEDDQIIKEVTDVIKGGKVQNTYTSSEYEYWENGNEKEMTEYGENGKPKYKFEYWENGIEKKYTSYDEDGNVDYYTENDENGNEIDSSL